MTILATIWGLSITVRRDKEIRIYDKNDFHDEKVFNDGVENGKRTLSKHSTTCISVTMANNGLEIEVVNGKYYDDGCKINKSTLTT